MEINARGWLHARAWMFAVLMASGLCSACTAIVPGAAEDTGLADGALCSKNDECKSGTCGVTTRLCAHSTCDCPGNSCDPQGEPSSDCAHGWDCVYYESFLEDVGEAFMIHHDMQGGYCQPLCDSGCPEHYSCAGRFCKIDEYWAYPVPTVSWSGAVSGEINGRDQMTEVTVQHDKTVTLTASATSPVHAPIAMFQWVLVSTNDRVQSMGQGLELSVDAGSFKRAELTVLDAESRAAILNVSFTACSGPGDACGYQGSGCCNACDSASNTCM